MKALVNQMIPHAIKAAEAVLCEKDKTGRPFIPREFNGYIASFGAAVIQSGLVAAMAFFKHDERTEEKRSLVLRALFKTIYPDKQEADLLEYYLTAPDSTRRYLNETVLDAATALKLAIRTFELKDR